MNVELKLFSLNSTVGFKVKTSELISPALDWAVSVAEMNTDDGSAVLAYSTDWAQGGPMSFKATCGKFQEKKDA